MKHFIASMSESFPLQHQSDIDNGAIESTPKAGNLRPGLSTSTQHSSFHQELMDAQWGRDNGITESTPKTSNQRLDIASVKKHSCWGELALSVADDSDLILINDRQPCRESSSQKETRTMLKKSKSKQGSRSRSRSHETLDWSHRSPSNNRSKSKELENASDSRDAVLAHRSNANVNANTKAIHKISLVASKCKQRSKSVDQKGHVENNTETKTSKHRRRSKSTDLCDTDFGTNVTVSRQRKEPDDLTKSYFNLGDLENSKHQCRTKPLVPTANEPYEHDDTQIRRRLSANPVETIVSAINVSKHRRQKKSTFSSCGESIVDDIDVPNFLRRLSHDSAGVEMSKRLSQINIVDATEGELHPTPNAIMRKAHYTMKTSKSSDHLDNRGGVGSMPKSSRLSLRSMSMDPNHDDDHCRLSLTCRSRSLDPSNELQECHNSLSDETFIHELGHTPVHSLDPAFDPSFFVKKKEIIKNKSVELLDRFFEREGEPKQYIVVLNGGIENVGSLDSSSDDTSQTKTVVTSRCNRSAKMEASVTMNRSKSPWPGMTSQRRRVEDPFAAVKTFQYTHNVRDRAVQRSHEGDTSSSSNASIQSSHAKSTRGKEDGLTSDTTEAMGTKHNHCQRRSTDFSHNHVEELMAREDEKKDRTRRKSSKETKTRRIKDEDCKRRHFTTPA